MTNGEKYLKDGVKEELIADLANYIRIHNTDTRSYLDILHSYFDKPAKSTLTEDEKVILKKLDKGARTIRRVSENDLYVEYYFTDCRVGKDLPYSHLFQFIKPRRRI